ncbi:MAG: BatD family protein [Elusimicrobiales bacterium]
MNLIGKLLLLPFLFCFELVLSSQTTVVSAWVDKKTVPINESFTLTISVTGTNALNAKPDLPAIFDFNIYSSGKSSNISVVNGQISSTAEFSYTLTPKKTGKFVIPKIGIFTGNEKYFTKEIEVEVTPPSFSNQPSQQTYPKQPKQKKQNISSDELIFVKAYTDKKSAYPGEQITLSIKFYTALPISSNPQYLPPSYSNLISEELPPVKTGTEVINGVRYYYAEVKTALFGIMPGKASVSPATIIAYTQSQSEEELDPFDPNFIQKFFSKAVNTKEVKLQTKPIEIQINPLSNPPADFSNGVGNFFITAKADQNTVNMGDAINLTVEITGKGNVKSINPPEFKSENFKVYDVLSSETLSKNNDIVGGTKKITYIISPTREGEIKIDPIKFTFFNIDSQKYETIYSEPIKIKVLKPKDGKTYDFDKTPIQNEISKKDSDINYVYEKSKSVLIFKASKFINEFKMYINAVLILILLINYFTNKKLEIIASNPKEYAYKKALSNFKEKIKTVKFEPESKKILGIIYDSIYDYLSAKLKKNIGHLTFSKLEAEILSEKKDFSKELLSELKKTIEKIEFLNYAASEIKKEEMEKLITETFNLMEKIEKEFSK